MIRQDWEVSSTQLSYPSQIVAIEAGSVKHSIRGGEIGRDQVLGGNTAMGPTRALGFGYSLQMSQVCGVQGSGFRVQDFRVYVELQVLNPDHWTLASV